MPDARPLGVHEELMKDMGSDKGFDPIPPDQYLTYLSETESPEQRALAWMRAHTIRMGHRKPYAVNSKGRELHLADMARDLKWEEANVYRTWKFMEVKGLVSRKGQKLFLSGRIVKNQQLTRKNSSVQTIQPYLQKQLEKL